MTKKEKKLFKELISHSANNNPSKAEEKFEEIMLGKIKDILKKKQSEIIQNISK